MAPTRNKVVFRKERNNHISKPTRDSSRASQSITEVINEICNGFGVISKAFERNCTGKSATKWIAWNKLRGRPLTHKPYPCLDGYEQVELFFVNCSQRLSHATDEAIRRYYSDGVRRPVFKARGWIIRLAEDVNTLVLGLDRVGFFGVFRDAEYVHGELNALNGLVRNALISLKKVGRSNNDD